jgi:hypothetical protein
VVDGVSAFSSQRSAFSTRPGVAELTADSRSLTAV